MRNLGFLPTSSNIVVPGKPPYDHRFVWYLIAVSWERPTTSLSHFKFLTYRKNEINVYHCFKQLNFERIHYTTTEENNKIERALPPEIVEGHHNPWHLPYFLKREINFSYFHNYYFEFSVTSTPIPVLAPFTQKFFSDSLDVWRPSQTFLLPMACWCLNLRWWEANI